MEINFDDVKTIVYVVIVIAIAFASYLYGYHDGYKKYCNDLFNNERKNNE